VPDVRALRQLPKRALLFELSLYRSLFRWGLRRPVADTPEERPVGYSQLVAPVLWLWIFGSAVEVVVVHLLLPWDSLRTAALVIGIWGLLWMIGLLASMRAYPHLVAPDYVRVRQGPRVDLRIPWADVESVTARRRELPSSIRAVQVQEADGETDLHVAVSGETNVSMVLRRPLALRTPGGEVTADRVSLMVDDPKAFLADVRQRLGAVTRR